MKTSRLVLLFFLLLLGACAPRRPEFPAPEVPAEPLLRALKERSSAFLSLRATASAYAYRNGRRVGFENVGVIVKSRERFRIDAYGPLGQPLLEIAWDGSAVQVRQYGEPVLLRPGAGLERYLGADVEPGELCAILTGNVPTEKSASGVHAFCGEEGCALILEQDGLARRVRLAPDSQSAGSAPLEAYEVLRGRDLLYRVRFEQWAAVSNYAVPRKVVIESPDRGAGLTVLYEDIELNTPLEDAVFILSDRKGEGR